MIEEIIIAEVKLGDFILEYKKSWSGKFVRVMQITEVSDNYIYGTQIEPEIYMEYYDDQTDEDLFKITELNSGTVLSYTTKDHFYYTHAEFFKITGLELNRLLIGAI